MTPINRNRGGEQSCLIDPAPAPDRLRYAGPPRTGPELVLATRPFASDAPLKSWYYVLSTSAMLATGLACAFWLPHPLLRLCASVLSALLALRMFVIYHDQQHHAILPRSKAAEVFMWIFGICALSPSSIWRSSHNHHHNHNSKLRGSHIGSFPIMTAESFRKSSRINRFKYLFMRHPLTLLFGYLFTFIFGMCINPLVCEPKKHWDGLLALGVHALFGVLLYRAGGWQAVVFVQTIPCSLLYSIGSYLFYIQHNFPAVVLREHSGWTYEGAALDSSSFLRVGPVMAWFTANIGYHHIHHLNAKIPFYRLPEAMRGIPELQSPKCTSLHPAEIWRCLRLKVWDVKEQKMTRY